MLSRRLFVWLAASVWAMRALAADGATLVFVSNQDDATVSVIDTATDTVVATIPVAFAPACIAVDPKGKTLYVTHPDRGEVSVIDTAQRLIEPEGLGLEAVDATPGTPRASCRP